MLTVGNSEAGLDDCSQSGATVAVVRVWRINCMQLTIELKIKQSNISSSSLFMNRYGSKKIVLLHTKSAKNTFLSTGTAPLLLFFK